MAGVNKAIVIGRVGKDPERRDFNDGGGVVTFSVATSDKWKNKSTGEWQERTDWHNIAIFNTHLQPIAEQYVRKGSLVWIEGEMRTRKWKDQAGNDRYMHEIVLAAFRGSLTLLDKPAQSGDRQQSRPAERAPYVPPERTDDKGNPYTPPSDDDLNDAIPF